MESSPPAVPRCSCGTFGVSGPRAGIVNPVVRRVKRWPRTPNHPGPFPHPASCFFSSPCPSPPGLQGLIYSPFPEPCIPMTPFKNQTWGAPQPPPPSLEAVFVQHQARGTLRDAALQTSKSEEQHFHISDANLIFLFFFLLGQHPFCQFSDVHTQAAW